MIKKILNFKITLLYVSILYCCCSTLLLRAQELELDWYRTTGSNMPNLETGYGITLDDSGYVYTTGAFAGTAVTFGSGTDTLTLQGNGIDQDIFAIKQDAAGKLIWARTFPCKGDFGNAGQDIKVDSSGNVYVIGYFSDSIRMGGSTQPFASYGNSRDIFLVKLDKAGNTVWATSMGGVGTDMGTSLDLDKEGNIYVCGNFQATMFIGSTSMLSSAGRMFAAKFDSNGNFIWASQLGGTASTIAPTGLVVDKNNNTYLTGTFYANSATFGNVTLPGGGFGTLFVVKLNGNGAVTWAKGNQVDSKKNGEAWGTGIALDGENNVHISGVFLAASDIRGAVDFNLSPLPADTFWLRENASVNGSAFVLKLDNDGNFIWAKPFLGNSGRSFFAMAYSSANRISLDVQGNVYTTGHFRGSVDFDPGSNTSVISTDSVEYFGMTMSLTNAFISKLDKNGNGVWAKSLKSKGLNTDASSFGRAIAVNPYGGVVYTTGSFSDTVNFATGTSTQLAISQLSTTDIYIHKLTCANRDTAAVLAVDADCTGYTINGQTYSESGLYYTTFIARTGCDSVVAFNLTITLPEPVINVNVDTLGTQTYARYQWLKNGAIIEGATNRLYVVTENADYQVIVTDENGCTDTSGIYKVSNVHVSEVSGKHTFVQIYPNPAADFVYIQSYIATDVALSTIDGRVLRKEKNAKMLSLKQLPQGIYLLHITDSKGGLLSVEKIVKQ